MKVNERINDLINQSGLKKNYIAKELDIKYDTLRKKLKGEGDFKVAEIYQLSQILNVEMEEFFK